MHVLALVSPLFVPRLPLHISASSHIRCCTELELAPTSKDKSRSGSWTGATSATIEIDAPVSLVCAAYSDIERMCEWSPLLESVVLLDPVQQLSQWKLRIPMPLRRLARAIGAGRVVCWEAVHEVDPLRSLSWHSINGIQNSGCATFCEISPVRTALTLEMSYTLPGLIRPLVEAPFAQRFVRRTLLSTMECFRRTLEDEVQAAADRDSC